MSITTMPFKLGRNPRMYDPRIPHLSALMSGQPPTPVPKPVDYSKGMATNLGAMLNDLLGDCTCAGWGHAVQVWTFNTTGTMLTLPNSDIEDLYEMMGYVPGNPSTDQGAIEQLVLATLLQIGLAGHKLTGYIEVDVRSMDDIKRTIDWCGVAYIGFLVPNYIKTLMTPGAIWGVPGEAGIPLDADTRLCGGHCVIWVGFDENDFLITNSWGSWYKMTPAFRARFVDEVYGLIDSEWVKTTGKTPANLTLAETQQLMQPLAFNPLTGYSIPSKSKLDWFTRAFINNNNGGTIGGEIEVDW
ncbi:MAG: hypothetical protein KGL39_28190 [Patescibacteria group bacterium]|nr:hypothetical protein [Patescibacteria group bacterium]